MLEVTALFGLCLCAHLRDRAFISLSEILQGTPVLEQLIVVQ